MKKFTIFVLIIVLVAALPACKKKNNPGDETTETNELSDGSSSGSDSDNAQISPTNTDAPDPSDVTITRQVLGEKDDIVIEVRDINPEGEDGTELVVYIENNSEDGIVVEAGNISVNGFMIKATYSEEVEAETKSESLMLLPSSELELSDIDIIREVEMNLQVFESETWDELFTIDNVLVRTSYADTVAAENVSAGITVYEDEDFKVVYKGQKYDISPDYKLVFYVENNTSDNIMIQTRDVVVEDIEIQPSYSYEILAGKKAMTALTFTIEHLEAMLTLEESYNLDENGDEESEAETRNLVELIEGIEDIEMKFEIFNSADWETILTTDLVTLENF